MLKLLKLLLPRKFNREKALAYLKQWEALCKSEGGKCWGIDLRTPFVIIDEATRNIAANEEGLGDTFPEDLVISASAFTYQEKRWAMAPWRAVAASNEKDRLKLLVHEAFHALQPSLFGEMEKNGDNNAHLEELDARVLFFVEMNALLAALKSEGNERITAAQAALHARNKRREKYGAGAEARNEIAEGTAVYTEVMIATPNEILRRMEKDVKGARGQGLPSFMGYCSGAMYCFVLDAFKTDWKPGLNWGSDLGVLLNNIVGNPTNIPDLNKYGYDEIYKKEKIEYDKTQAELKVIKDAFETRPLLRCFEKDCKVAIMGMPIEVPGFGSVLRGSIQLFGDFGKMMVNEGKFLRAIRAKGERDFLRHNDGYYAVFAEDLKIEGDKVSGTYWELALNEGYTIVADGDNFKIQASNNNDSAQGTPHRFADWS